MVTLQETIRSNRLDNARSAVYAKQKALCEESCRMIEDRLMKTPELKYALGPIVDEENNAYLYRHAEQDLINALYGNDEISESDVIERLREEAEENCRLTADMIDLQKIVGLLWRNTPDEDHFPRNDETLQEYVGNVFSTLLYGFYMEVIDRLECSSELSAWQDIVNCDDDEDAPY